MIAGVTNELWMMEDLYDGVTGALSPHQKNTVYRMLTALPSSLTSVTIAQHLFWQSHDPTPALVWYFCGLLFGYLASLFIRHSIQSIVRRFCDRSGNSPIAQAEQRPSTRASERFLWDATAVKSTSGA